MKALRAFSKGPNSFGYGRVFLFKCTLSLIVIISLLSPAVGPGASAQQGDRPWFEVRSIYMADYAVHNPQGMTFSPEAEALLALDGEGNITSVALSGDAFETGRSKIPVENAQNVAFNESTKSLFVLNHGQTQIEEFSVDESGLPQPSLQPVKSYDLRAINLHNARGMTFDPKNGRLFVLNEEGNQLVSVTPSTALGLDGSAAILAGRVKRIDLKQLGYAALQGVAFNPNNGNLALFDPASHRLFEITQTGKRVSVYDLSQLQLVNPRSILFAPSVDSTDDLARMNLFILDSAGAVPSANLDEQKSISAEGRIVEVALTALAAAPSNLLPSTLIHTIDTSNAAWNPSSTDPAGVVYWSAHNTLLISDSEVDAVPAYWAGKNVFESTLSGSLVRTCTTYPGFSKEPTGISLNPNNSHVFFSDDDANRISEVNPGSDRTYCTSDDTVTYVDVMQTYNIPDAEDVAYAQNTIIIAGGTDAEVYMFGLGANGVLGGGDDGPLTHFDTSVLGFQDLEGVGYNPDRGTLFILSTQASNSYLGEVSTSGTLLYAYNLAYLGGNPRSGIAYAPSSQNPSLRNVYIASRGVDNGTDPNENDGKIWEVALTSSTSTATPSTPTNTPTVTPPAAISRNPLYISLTSNGTVGGVASADEDILRFNGQTWSLFFDGSDVGLGSTDTFGFSILNANTILFSFSNAITLGGLAVTPRDIVRFDATSLGGVTAGTFSMYLNGIDVGLDTTSENVDSISVLPDGRVLVSTSGSPSVPGLSGADEDILAFMPTMLGDVTSGTWTMYFDGSDVGLSTTSDEDIDALDVIAGKIYLSTLGNFSVTGILGADEDVFICSPTSLGSTTACNYSAALYFDGSTWGLDSNDVDAFNFLDLTSPTSTPSATATQTATQTSTSTPTATATASPTATMTRTATSSPTPTTSETPTATPSPTSDNTEIATPTPSDTPIPSPTDTATATPSSTEAMTQTTTSSPTPTDTESPTGTPSPTSDNTETATPTPSDTPIPTPTATATASATPSNTPTKSPTPSVTATPTAAQANSPFYLSLNSGGTVGGITAEDVDIVYFDGTNWSLFFDASDVGISTSGRDLNDFSIIDSSTVLMTFDAVTTLGSLTADPWDVVQFNATSLGNNTAGTFSMYLDGNDVGLDTTSEIIDALDVLPDGRILISTTSNSSVPGLSALDEDIMAFTPITLGDTTSGSWAMYFDGSDVGLADSGNEDVSGLHITPSGEIHLSTLGDFSVSGISGTNEDIFVCIPTAIGDNTACNYATSLYFDGSLWALDSNSVDGIYIP